MSTLDIGGELPDERPLKISLVDSGTIFEFATNVRLSVLSCVGRRRVFLIGAVFEETLVLHLIACYNAEQGEQQAEEESMANQEQVEILKQGVDAWNTWRRKHWNVRLDLSNADLSGADLRSADLRSADLSEAELFGVDFSEADLSGADLKGANLTEANLHLANFHTIYLFCTVFAWADLRVVKGLDTIIHEGPSTINVNTVKLPEGETRLLFLRGAGFSDPFIASYAPTLG